MFIKNTAKNRVKFYITISRDPIMLFTMVDAAVVVSSCNTCNSLDCDHKYGCDGDGSENGGVVGSGKDVIVKVNGKVPIVTGPW